MPAWPAELPQYFNEAGYDETLIDNAVRTPMDAGVLKIRRRFTGDFVRVNGSMDMDAAEFLVFETFYSTTLAAGSLSFTWVHPVTRVARTFRFVAPYRAAVFGVDNRRVQMQLEMRP